MTCGYNKKFSFARARLLVIFYEYTFSQGIFLDYIKWCFSIEIMIDLVILILEMNIVEFYDVT